MAYCYNNQEMCNKAVENYPYGLDFVPECYKAEKMCDKAEKRKELQKELSEELMPVAWHPNRWWGWCMSEDEKKEIDPMFIEEL